MDATTNQPVDGAVVTINPIGKSQITNAAGKFLFENIAASSYTLSVNHVAYSGIELQALICTEKNDTLKIFLRPVLFQSDEVIIKSTRISSSITNTPYPLDVRLSEQLIQNQKVTISDVISDEPGVALARDGTWQTAISIRGLSRSNIISLIDNIRVETANDIAGALSLININDLERVETIKSSGSVLYGTGALGGVVHFVTKRPLFSRPSKVNIELTNSMSSVDGGLSNFAAIEGTTNRYSLRFSGGYRNAGNTKTPSGMLPNSQYHDFSFNGSLGIKTLGNQSFFLLYQRSQAEDTGIPGGSAFGPTSMVRYTLARRELFGLEYNIPSFSSDIALITMRFSRQEITRNVEIIQSPVITVTPHATHTTLSAQLDLKIIPLPDHLLVVGGEAWERVLDSRREKRLTSQNKIIGERPIPISKFFSSGIYAQDEWTILSAKLTLTTGARYDWIRVSNEKTYNPEYVITSGTIKTNSVDSTILWKKNSAHDESWSANIGLNYFLNSKVSLTFLSATAFRSPSLEERYQFLDLGNGLVQVGNPNLQPERSISFNTGFKIYTDKLKIQTDLFLNQLTNLISEEAGFFEGRPALIKKNIGKVQLYGYEISIETIITNPVILKAFISYVRGEDVRNNSNLPQITPFKGGLELNGFVNRLGTISISCSFYDEQKNLAIGEAQTPGYANINISFLSVPISVSPFSLIIRTGINNLLDKSYRNHLSTLRGIIKDEPGRNIFLSLTLLI